MKSDCREPHEALGGCDVQQKEKGGGILNIDRCAPLKQMRVGCLSHLSGPR